MGSDYDLVKGFGLVGELCSPSLYFREERNWIVSFTLEDLCLKTNRVCFLTQKIKSIGSEFYLLLSIGCGKRRTGVHISFFCTLKMTEMKGSTSSATNANTLKKEWDETACPICMDHPHNAVLLLCSSHEKGCRSYICDTSYRHSNCLDRFKKLRPNNIESDPQPNPSSTDNTNIGGLVEAPPQAMIPEPSTGNMDMRRNLMEASEDHNSEDLIRRTSMNLLELLEENTDSQGPNSHQQANVEERIRHQEDSGVGNTSESNFLSCPLCRGSVLGWMIVKEARQYLDLKSRSCSREACSFSGTYGELRRHARRVHPATRPGDVDPSRQRAWHRLEHQREYGDIVSAIRSAMPGAVVLGDYVIDNGDMSFRDREGPGSGEGGGGPWWTTFFLFQMISSPSRSLNDSRGSSRNWRTHRRSSGGHQNLWGENLLGLQDDDGDANVDEDVPRPRRRRRFMRSRHDDEEQP